MIFLLSSEHFKAKLFAVEAKPSTIDQILEKDYSFRFDDIRQKMVATSHYKYGPARDNFASGRVDALKTAELCIEAFKSDGNLEHLCDAANYLMFRFKYPMPGEEYRTTDSSESVGTVGTPINMEKEY